MRVLMVDDSPEDRMVVRLALESQGYLLNEMDNGERGVAAAAALRPDCILLDYRLPDLDGLEVLKALRRPDGTMLCAVVMLTGSSNGETAATFLKCGALDYLAKERLNEDSLRRAVEGAVERFRLIEQRRQVEERNAQLASIVAASNDAIVSIGLDGCVTSWNTGAVALFGYTEEEAIGRALDELIVPAHMSEQRRKLYEDVKSGRMAVMVEEYRLHKNGSLVAVELNASPILDQAGHVRGISVVFRDISARKLQEKRQQETEEGIRRQATLIETIYNTAHVGLCMLDRDLRFVRINERLAEINGMPAADHIGKKPLEVVPALAEAVDKIAEQIFRTGEPMLDIEISGMTPSQPGVQRYWIEQWVPLKDENGAIFGINVSVEEITDRKRHEERTQLLMKEVNHRVKNIISVVQAVARQTAATGADDFIERFGQRLQALAANQDLLVNNDWKSVSLGDLIRAQLVHFGDLRDTRVSLGGPEVELTAAASQVLGMALHELATNAAKYGALSNETGRVAISWTVCPDAEGAARFALSWVESGGPAVEKPSRRGFGSTVIGRMIGMNLGCDPEIDFAPSGLVWRIHCPAERVLLARIAPSTAQASSATREIASRSSRRVLVVDDEALIALEIADVLSAAGFEVLGPANTVAQALHLIAQQDFDVAVLDVNLGGESAEPVAHELTRISTPFVVLSGYSREQQPAVMRSAPLISKPLRPDLLVAELGRCLMDNNASSRES